MTEAEQVVAAGSSDVRLRDREEAIARLLAFGWSHKKIAATMRLSRNSIGVYVREAADKIPGPGAPSVKLAVWYVQYRVSGIPRSA